MNKVNEIVKQILLQHTGGKEFFENLDLAVRDKDIVQSLYDFVEKTMSPYAVNFIVSGKFGEFFSNWIQCNGSDTDTVYLVNGSLRNGEPIVSLEPFKEDITGFDYIILDDSYYSGRTVNIIKEHVNSLGGVYKGTFVVYDGCEEKHSDIHSLYRYYES